MLYRGLEPDLDNPLNWLAFAILLGVLLWCVLREPETTVLGLT